MMRGLCAAVALAFGADVVNAKGLKHMGQHGHDHEHKHHGHDGEGSTSSSSTLAHAVDAFAHYDSSSSLDAGGDVPHDVCPEAKATKSLSFQRKDVRSSLKRLIVPLLNLLLITTNNVVRFFIRSSTCRASPL